MVFKQPILQKLDNKIAGFLVKLAFLCLEGLLFGIPALRGNLFGVSFSFQQWSMFVGRRSEGCNHGFQSLLQKEDSERFGLTNSSSELEALYARLIFRLV